MWTAEGWTIAMPRSLAEDLAWSLAALSGEEGGLGAVTIRSLARHVRMAPGTITNHYASKQELWGVCATVVGRWLAQATSDRVRARGAIGLFPTSDDRDRSYRLLVSTWAQLRAQALTDTSIDERVEGIAPLLRSSMRDAFDDSDGEVSVAAWACVEGLRQELVRPGSELTPGDALSTLQRVEPDARREPPEGETVAWA